MDFVSLVPSTLSALENNASYSCTLTNRWSAETHPVLYDAIQSSAHWSPPVLATHSESYDLWAPGALVTPGVNFVAKMGITAPLEQEILEAQTNGLAGDFTIGKSQFNARDGPQTFETIELTPEFAFLSTVTMLAPSPDWFTGIPKFTPIDDIDGVWYETFELATYPWDAGSETGDEYNMSNAAQVPMNPITQLTFDTVPENGILLSPSRTVVLPVAVWTCQLQLPEPEPEVLSTDPTAAPVEEDVVAISDEEQEPQEDQIVVIVEDRPDILDEFLNNVTLIEEDEEPDDKDDKEENDNDEDNNEENDNDEDEENGVCLRYFGSCLENSDCCSDNCSRKRCSARSRGSGRDQGLRLSNQGGSTVGGAAGRNGRGSKRGGDRALALELELAESAEGTEGERRLRGSEGRNL